jgi:hypothetical protein
MLLETRLGRLRSRRQREEEPRQSLLKRERYEVAQRVGLAVTCNDGTSPESPVQYNEHIEIPVIGSLSSVMSGPFF